MSNTTKSKVNQVIDNKEKLFSDTNISMKTGHLVRDAEIVGDGKFAKIRIASNKQYLSSQDEGVIETKTNYFDSLVSSNLTKAFETAKELKKGDWVYLKGEDSTRSVDTPEGFKETASTIFAYKVVLKKKKINEASSQTPDKPEAPTNEPSAA